MHKRTKRVIIATLIGATFFLCAHLQASASAEFCPATLAIQAVGSSDASAAPAVLYGMQLGALSARTITSATLAFDTSGGWYTVGVPQVMLAAKVQHYSAPWVAFTRVEYVSPVMYLKFPSAVKISHAWVYDAAARDDGAFAWQSKGNVTCDAPPADSPQQASESKNNVGKASYTLDPKDEDRLSDAPSSGSLVLQPHPSAALENAECAEPFRQAYVKYQSRPQYPPVQVDMPASTLVEIAVDADGTLKDAWVWGPSGVPQFDDAALRAAKGSTYVGGRAYCRAVPAQYFFRVTFAPN